jgi:hypothetical protein
MNYIGNTDKNEIDPATANNYINAFNLALFDVQEANILRQRNQVVQQNLINAGTAENPNYIPMLGTSNTIIIGGDYGQRYYIYPNHKGTDLLGSIKILASASYSSMSMSYDRYNGLRMTGNFNYNNDNYMDYLDHLSQKSLMDYINLVASNGAVLEQLNGGTSYLISGVNAGVQIATMGNTGLASNGQHLHWERRILINDPVTHSSRYELINPINNDYISFNNLVANRNDFAKYLTGYNNLQIDYNNINLNGNIIKNIIEYGKKYPKNLDLSSFLMNNLNTLKQEDKDDIFSYLRDYAGTYPYQFSEDFQYEYLKWLFE